MARYIITLDPMGILHLVNSSETSRFSLFETKAIHLIGMNTNKNIQMTIGGKTCLI